MRPATARTVNGPQQVELFGRWLDGTHTTFRQRGEAAHRLRLRFLAASLHALGPKPLIHLFEDLERGADLRGQLEDYAALRPIPSGLIAAINSGRAILVKGGSR
jgi:hypothetical protein